MTVERAFWCGHTATRYLLLPNSACGEAVLALFSERLARWLYAEKEGVGGRGVKMFADASNAHLSFNYNGIREPACSTQHADMEAGCFQKTTCTCKLLSSTRCSSESDQTHKTLWPELRKRCRRPHALPTNQPPPTPLPTTNRPLLTAHSTAALSVSLLPTRLVSGIRPLHARAVAVRPASISSP